MQFVSTAGTSIFLDRSRLVTMVDPSLTPPTDEIEAVTDLGSMLAEFEVPMFGSPAADLEANLSTPGAWVHGSWAQGGEARFRDALSELMREPVAATMEHLFGTARIDRHLVSDVIREGPLSGIFSSTHISQALSSAVCAGRLGPQGSVVFQAGDAIICPVDVEHEETGRTHHWHVRLVHANAD